jgi:hypothetical protein
MLLGVTQCFCCIPLNIHHIEGNVKLKVKVKEKLFLCFN